MRQAFPGKDDPWSTTEALVQGVVTWELGYALLADVQALAEGARPPVVTVTVGAASGTAVALEELIQLRRTLIVPSLEKALLARNKAGS
jgi:hypothetical protein